MILLMIDPQKFRQLRESKGMTTRGLAREAGVSTETINAIEHGRRDFIWPRTAGKLADALGVDPSDLYR